MKQQFDKTELYCGAKGHYRITKGGDCVGR